MAGLSLGIGLGLCHGGGGTPTPTPSITFTGNPYFIGNPIEGEIVALNVGTVDGAYDTMEIKITEQAGGTTVMDWAEATSSSSWALASTLGLTLIPYARAKTAGLVVATSGAGTAFGVMAAGEVMVFAGAINNGTVSVGLSGAVQFSFNPLTTANSPQFTVNPNTNYDDPWFKHGWGGTSYTSSGLSTGATGSFNNKLDGRLTANVTMGQGHLAVEVMKNVQHKFYMGCTSTAGGVTANIAVKDGSTGAAGNLVAVAPTTVGNDKVLDASGAIYDGAILGGQTAAYNAWQAAGGGIYGGVGVAFTPTVETTAASGDSPAKSTLYIGKNSGSATSLGWVAITRFGGTGLTVRPEGMKVVVDVTTSAALVTAAVAARPGTLIRLNGGIAGVTTVAAFAFTSTLSKRAPGIFIEVPSAQVWQINIANSAGLTFIGGKASGDLVAGNATGSFSTNTSVRIATCSRIGVVSMLLGQGAKNAYITDSSDILLKYLNTEATRDDVTTTLNVTSFLMEDIYFREPTVRGEKLQWYNDGTAPIDITVDTGLPGYGVTNFIADTSHHDFHQPLDGTINDFKIKTVDGHGALQGLWRGGAAIVDLGRSHIEDVQLRITDPQMINIGGSDLTVVNCSVGPDPNYPNPYASSIFNVERIGAGRVRGYGCSITSGGTITDPTGVDLTLGTMNGDAAVSPTAPSVALPAWMGTYSRPTPVARSTAPDIITPPSVYHTNDAGGATAAVGTRFTVGLAHVWGRETMTGQEWRWTSNGTPIGGETGRTFNSTGRAAAEVIRCESRVQNAFGWSAWSASGGVTLT